MNRKRRRHISIRTSLAAASFGLALAVTLAACSKKANWTEYEHPEGRLTVSFPTAEIPSGDGTGKALSVFWNNVSYTVTWVDIPDWSKEEFRNNLESRARRQGTVSSSARVSQAGLDGMEFTLDGPSNATTFVRYLRKGNRVYMLKLEGSKLDPSAPAPQQFLASFRAE